MEEPFVRYVLLLPLKFNDGQPVPLPEIRRMLTEIYALADGYSLAGTVSGAYRMRNGTRQEDESLEVWIIIREERVPQLRSLVGRIGKALGQEAMYLERTGGTIYFIPPEP